MSEQLVYTVHGRGSEDAIRRALALARTQGHRLPLIVASVRPVLGQTGDERRDELAWTVGLVPR